MYRDEKHDSNQTPLPQHTSGEGGQPLYLPWQTAHQPTTAHPDLLVHLPLFLMIHSVVLWTSMAPPLKAVLRMRRMWCQGCSILGRLDLRRTLLPGLPQWGGTLRLKKGSAARASTIWGGKRLGQRRALQKARG